MVGFTAKHCWFQIGTGDFLHGFFSTVCGNLENGTWGSRFPRLMKELYQGSLPAAHVDEATRELNTIQEELRCLPVSRLIWDIKNRSAQPPWGDKISPDIHNLAEYFVTNEGDDFITIFFAALSMAASLDCDLIIRSL